MEQITIYNNIAQVRLEGARALQPVDWMSESQITYYIGDEKSNIRVNDYRTGPNQSAIEAIGEKDRKSFYKSFSQPASVVIKEHDDGILIELSEPEGSAPEYPILWLGLSKGDNLDHTSMSWFTLRDTGGPRKAFAALLKPNSTASIH